MSNYELFEYKGDKFHFSVDKKESSPKPYKLQSYKYYEKESKELNKPQFHLMIAFFAAIAAAAVGYFWPVGSTFQNIVSLGGGVLLAGVIGIIAAEYKAGTSEFERLKEHAIAIERHEAYIAWRESKDL
jgi:hypothetical protein